MGKTNAYMPGKPFYQYSYKADFQAPVGEFGDVVVPFSNFSIDWDAGTGEPITTCAQNVTNCPPMSVLQDLQELGIWAQAFESDIHLEVKRVRATDCSAIIV